ncbi:hypothetical protein K402DRAFT_254023 [Aulographum hederae CBS 113979]|uniref:Flavin reductase like domain-containing protein n=1 Tax=Aulographum hederae CBS 113979 TaxID=1176131 RepID=A0A6G1GJ05_9PEZI|nr:hypothetical protein K402DRAFT_254023 [Aulographum hederae CBS 113979]
MRAIPHPVVVISASSQRGVSPLLHTLVASSFNTVTLIPTPVVSFNVALPSRTMDAIRGNRGEFLVHFPVASPKGSEIASICLKHKELGLWATLKHAGHAVVWNKSIRLHTFHDRPENTTVVPAALHCRQLGQLPVGDHAIITAEVLSVEWPEKTPFNGLIYGQQHFARWEVLTPNEESPKETTRSQTVRSSPQSEPLRSGRSNQAVDLTLGGLVDPALVPSSHVEDMVHRTGSPDAAQHWALLAIQNCGLPYSGRKPAQTDLKMMAKDIVERTAKTSIEEAVRFAIACSQQAPAKRHKFDSTSPFHTQIVLEYASHTVDHRYPGEQNQQVRSEALQYIESLPNNASRLAEVDALVEEVSADHRKFLASTLIGRTRCVANSLSTLLQNCFSAMQA